MGIPDITAFENYHLVVISTILCYAALGLIATGLILAIKKNKKIWHIMTVAGGAAMAIGILLTGMFMIPAATNMIKESMDEFSGFPESAYTEEFFGEDMTEDETELLQNETSGVYLVGDFYPVVFLPDYETNDLYLLDAATKEWTYILECGYYSFGNIPKDTGFDYIDIEDYDKDGYNDIIITMDNNDELIFLYDVYYDYFYEISDFEM